MDAKHTILLVQSDQRRSSRTFHDYETLHDFFDGVRRLFETELKKLNPSVPHIQYNAGDVLSWLDQLPDASALVFEGSINAYVPHDREWVKNGVFAYLRKQSGQ